MDNIQEALADSAHQFMKAEIYIFESSSSAPINEILDCAVEYCDDEFGLKELVIQKLPEEDMLDI